jgi:hypothetical protein
MAKPKRLPSALLPSVRLGRTGPPYFSVECAPAVCRRSLHELVTPDNMLVFSRDIVHGVSRWGLAVEWGWLGLPPRDVLANF